MTTAAVVADLEALMRALTGPLPDYLPKLTTAEELLPAIKDAQKKYDDLISQHLAWGTAAMNQDAE